MATIQVVASDGVIDARVSLDNAPAMPVPVTFQDVPAGRVKLGGSVGGREVEGLRLTVAAGEVVGVRVDAERLVRAAPVAPAEDKNAFRPQPPARPSPGGPSPLVVGLLAVAVVGVFAALAMGDD